MRVLVFQASAVVLTVLVSPALTMTRRIAQLAIGTLAFALFIGPIAGFLMPMLLVPAAVTRESRDPAPEP